MKNKMPYIIVLASACYFMFYYGKINHRNTTIIDSSSIDYCSIEKRRFYLILKNSNFLHNLNESDYINTSLFGNTSLTLEYLAGKDNKVIKPLKNLGIIGEKTENGTKFTFDVRVDKIDTTQYLFVPCCLIATSLP